MRKIASHYWLRPDGSIGKFPVLVFDDQKKIVEIRERAVFKEEANLELVNGFLIPGFIDFIPTIKCQQELSQFKRYINLQLIGGTKVLGVSHLGIQKAKGLLLSDIVLVEYSGKELNDVNEVSAFRKIQESKDTLLKLMNFTLENAKRLGVDNNYGSLQLNKSPGLLSVSNIDYKTFEITMSSKIKIVI